MSYIGQFGNMPHSPRLFIVVLVFTIMSGLLMSGDAYALDSGRGSGDLAGPSSPQQQDVDSSAAEANLPYLFAVFIITWAGFFGYVFVMVRRRREMQREIEALRASLADKGHLSKQREQGSPAE
jgi:CcmD family protein